MSPNTNVWLPRSRFSCILSSQLSGFHSSVQNGTLTVWPKLYACSPDEPMAVMMEAL